MKKAWFALLLLAAVVVIGGCSAAEKTELKPLSTRSFGGKNGKPVYTIESYEVGGTQKNGNIVALKVFRWTDDQGIGNSSPILVWSATYDQMNVIGHGKAEGGAMYEKSTPDGGTIYTHKMVFSKNVSIWVVSHMSAGRRTQKFWVAKIDE
ncbi:MAG: hypothetical protein PHT40_03800 [Patescibacteria group bacterium]|nr:hypothetical protein [Patescibacteria group bacterium]